MGMDTGSYSVSQDLLSLLNSPFAIVIIFSFIINIAMIIAFFMMAYNVSQIRKDLGEWFDMEHPLVEDEHPGTKDKK